jgi:hypothetical protein
MKAGPIWKCVLGCAFFVYFKQDYILIGREFICWNCGLEFKLDEEAKAMDHPQCQACLHPELNEIDKFLAEKGL